MVYRQREANNNTTWVNFGLKRFIGRYLYEYEHNRRRNGGLSEGYSLNINTVKNQSCAAVVSNE